MRLVTCLVLSQMLLLESAHGQPRADDVADIQSIYLAQGDGFLALKGQPLETDPSGQTVWQGTVSLAGLNCRVIESAKTDPRGNLYECSNPNWSALGSSDPDGKKSYDEIKQAFDAAVPGLQWFNVGNRGTKKFAGTDKSNMTIDLRLMGGPTNSVVSVTFAASPFRSRNAD